MSIPLPESTRSESEEEQANAGGVLGPVLPASQVRQPVVQNSKRTQQQPYQQLHQELVVLPHEQATRGDGEGATAANTKDNHADPEVEKHE